MLKRVSLVSILPYLVFSQVGYCMQEGVVYKSPRTSYAETSELDLLTKAALAENKQLREGLAQIEQRVKTLRVTLKAEEPVTFGDQIRAAENILVSKTQIDNILDSGAETRQTDGFQLLDSYKEAAFRENKQLRDGLALIEQKVKALRAGLKGGQAETFADQVKAVEMSVVRETEVQLLAQRVSGLSEEALAFRIAELAAIKACKNALLGEDKTSRMAKNKEEINK